MHLEKQCFLILEVSRENVNQYTFLPNVHKDEEKTDQNYAIVRKTNSVPICTAVNDRLESNCLYSELLIISFET